MLINLLTFENAPDIQSGDIILFRNEFRLTSPVTWLAAGIRFFTKCEYNHAGVVVSNWGVLFINEALGNGVRCRPLAQYLKRDKSSILILRPKKPVNEKDFCTRANSKLGLKYNIKGIIDQLWYRLTGKWTGHTENFSEDRMVCTQYVAWCHHLKGWVTFSAKELFEHPDFHLIVYEIKD